MKTKTFLSASILLLAILLMIAQLALSLICAKSKANDNLLASPKTDAVQYDIGSLDELAKKIMLTYTLGDNVRIETAKGKKGIELIGTNHMFATILDYRIVSGGFFTQTALESGEMHAVLNKAAARNLFGSESITGQQLKISNKTFIAVGVIDDCDDKNSRVYIPSGLMDGKSLGLMVPPKQNFTQTMLRNELKSAGITDENYDIISLRAISENIQKKLLVSLYVFSIILSARLAYLLLKFQRATYKLFKSGLQSNYLFELLRKNKRQAVLILLSVVAFAAFVIASLFILIKIVELVLVVKDSTDLHDVVIKNYKPVIERLGSLALWSNRTFIASIVTNSILGCLWLSRKTPAK